MSLYGDYIAEREDMGIVECEQGFATYKIYENGECYLKDIYVSPAHRQSNIATEMANKIADIARERGCNVLVGSVCTDDKSATRNTKVLLAYGMDIYKTMGNMIFFRKRIR